MPRVLRRSWGREALPDERGTPAGPYNSYGVAESRAIPAREPEKMHGGRVGFNQGLPPLRSESASGAYHETKTKKCFDDIVGSFMQRP